jgi:hypothetical protein
MKNLFNAQPKHIRHALQFNMHKVAAVLTRQEGIPLPPDVDEINIKTAVFALGVKIAKQRFEKRAILDGIMSIARLQD